MALALMRLPERATVHDQYLAVSHLAEAHFAGRPGGRLFLRSGFDPEGIAALLASSVAGAASLCVEEDAELLRTGLRAGFCDFVVGHLDEALRILKNELRRGRAIAVGLTAEPEACLAEVVERGLQPDLVSASALASRSWTVLRERGAAAFPASAIETSTRALVEWGVDPAGSMPAMAQIAAGALDPTQPDTAWRNRWLERSPAYLGRSLGSRQCLRMTADEIEAFVAAVRSRFPSASVTVGGAAL